MNQQQLRQLSPRSLARIGGLLYLIIIVIGVFGQGFVRDRLVVSGNAAATAVNIRSMESLWRIHIAAELFLLICAVVLLSIFVVLLRPVSRDLILLAIFFNLVSIGIEAAISLSLVGALFPLGTAEYLKAFAPEQLYVLAMLSVRTHSHGFGVSLIFFGCFCLVVGYLIFRSGYLPKVIGVLMQIAGLCYFDQQLRADSFPRCGQPDIPRHSGSGIRWRGVTLPVAAGEGSGCREVGSARHCTDDTDNGRDGIGPPARRGATTSSP